MDYFKSLLLSMNYIEKNLKTEICIDDLAAISFFSIYHFQRVFQSFIGKTVMEYVKERPAI
jgi:AraC family transcriptional regulator